MGDPGYSSCAGGARVLRCRPGHGALRFLGASPAPPRRQPRDIAILGVPHTLGTSIRGLCRSGAAPSPIPELFPSPPGIPIPCYRHRPRNLPAGYSRLWSVSVCGVPQSPVTPDSGSTSLGFLFSLFLQYFRPSVPPSPGCSHSSRDVPIPRAPPSRSPRVLRGSPRSCAPSRWLGWGRAGWQAAKWLGAARHPPRSLPRGLHNVPWPLGSVRQPRGVRAPRGRGYVWFRGVAPVCVTQSPSARSHRQHDAPTPRADGRAEEGAVGHRAEDRGPGEGHPGSR